MGSLGTEISEEYCINNDDLIIIEEEEEESCGSWSNNNGYNGVNNGKLPLLSLNHVSYWLNLSNFMNKLFNYGIGIHLLEAAAIADESSNKNNKNIKKKINPKDNHISFQCSNMSLIMEKLAQLNIHYVTAVVEEGGIIVDQLFFHDPDGHMIEICNCQNLPVLPLVSSSSSCSSCPLNKFKPVTNVDAADDVIASSVSKMNKRCSEAAAVSMMDNLVMDMMNIYL
ncbi:hypothetical protein F8388_005265 [Cannabis sativa]|uniref:VOC domain-containing protein n=1 Tax=Cannabis sativa TaxID=3483 RepID=A0A7J6ELH6_CANSA|nr:hypothetical protein F8388_005265 [Cannabis sativa]KAF4375006.1 hypothetical protein G4B88_004757 [Cannabis sativa]